MFNGLWVMGYGLWVKMLITSNDSLRRHRCVKENLLDRTEKSKASPGRFQARISHSRVRARRVAGATAAGDGCRGVTMGPHTYQSCSRTRKRAVVEARN